MSAFFARIWEVTGSFCSMDIATKQLLMSCIQNDHTIDTKKVKDEYTVFTYVTSLLALNNNVT